MATLDELSLPLRIFLKAYPWRKVDPVPFVIPKKPLNSLKLALVSTAGFVRPGQPEFDHDFRGGDYRFREIPSDTPVGSLIESHRSESFDHTGLHQDANLGFPLERLKEMVLEGRIGSLNHRHFSFMGSITAPGRLIKETAPQVAGLLAQDAVDAALLVPV